MKEKSINEVIKKLVDTNGNKHRAAIRLGVTTKYINKLKNDDILPWSEKLPKDLKLSLK